MRRTLAYILAGLLATGVGWGATAQPLGPAVRFQAVNVLVDTGDEPLAAYQLDLRAATGIVRIVGIEGGEHPAFADPPYYDPAAIQGDRVIIGAFSTAPAGSLPTGRTRIATIHVRVTGDRQPEYKAELSVAATADGGAIPGRLILDMEPQR
jgi:hypothetical protein